jgi:outer membrane protein assembly factor BamD (BamD/ComL family)
MSVTGVFGTVLNSALSGTQSVQNNQGNFQPFQSEFQQLGQDLQAGNLSQAQQDFVTLSENFPGASQQTATSSNNSIAQAFNALSNDLQNGNLSAAQQDFATIQQAFQQHGSGQVHHHHGHHGGGGRQSNQIAEEFGALGQALQDGNLQGAQTAFAALQQDIQQFGASGSSNSRFGNSTSSTNSSIASTQSASGILNVTA